MPSRCAPWPGKSAPTRTPGRAAPSTTPTPGRPPATARSPAANSSRPAPTTTARCSKGARALTSDQPTSTASRPG
jgi:hypothetical protein